MTEKTLLSRARLLSEEAGVRTYAVRTGGKHLLLRLSGEETYEARRFEFVWAESLSDGGVPVPRPLEFGFMGEEVYSLSERERGVPLSLALRKMSLRRQKEIGIRVGDALRRMHGYPASGDAAWHIAFGREMDRTLAALRLSSIGEDPILEKLFREDGHHLFGQSLCYLHGGLLEGVRCRAFGRIECTAPRGTHMGDPWQELALFCFHYASAPEFALAAVRSYFQYYTPREFWKLALLYLSVDILKGLLQAPSGGDRARAELLRHHVVNARKYGMILP